MSTEGAALLTDSKDTMAAKTLHKPTSKLGVGIVKSIRFPKYKSDVPGVGQYETNTFLDLIASRCTSTRETFNTLEKKNSVDLRLKKNTCYDSPGPAVYNINYAIGRHVANDNKFALDKNTWLKMRDIENAEQMLNLKDLIGKHDIFTDKKACRRMAYLSLYYPLKG
ncbi:hypothetical protein HDV06_004628 [Boothiomyces sp. JEL0866]|nr:hypothetical protein HDV06_004628 [Boothiomyces sp. JEL0866]